MLYPPWCFGLKVWRAGGIILTGRHNGAGPLAVALGDGLRQLGACAWARCFAAAAAALAGLREGAPDIFGLPLFVKVKIYVSAPAHDSIKHTLQRANHFLSICQWGWGGGWRIVLHSIT